MFNPSANVDTDVTCGFRPRATSLILSGRYGGINKLPEQFAVVGSGEGVDVVLKHTFLELQLAGDADGIDSHSCCGSESDNASDSTMAASRGEDDVWSAGATDDECELEKPSSPPGTFHVCEVPNLVAVSMMTSPRIGPSFLVCSEGWKGSEIEKMKYTCSVWGSRRKSKKENGYTTIVIKNLPEKCTNKTIITLLDQFGFAGKYDFLYAPTDFRNYSAFGYAFVNMVSHEMGQVVIDVLDGFLMSGRKDSLSVDWSMPHQGHAVHVKRYQNSPVMHPSVPNQYKPMIFRNGVQQIFPAPTKRIKEPRLRRGTVPGIVN